jgi:hypothetical protein
MNILAKFGLKIYTIFHIHNIFQYQIIWLAVQWFLFPIVEVELVPPELQKGSLVNSLAGKKSIVTWTQASKVNLKMIIEEDFTRRFLIFKRDWIILSDDLSRTYFGAPN